MLDVKRIRYLTSLLPQDSPLLDPEGIGVQQRGRRHDLTMDPEFGYKFVLSFVSAGREMPHEVSEPWFCRLYDLLMDQCDDIVDQAVGLAESRRSYVSLIKACLLAVEIDVRHIAQRLQIPIPVLHAFHDLFFNVRPRASEPLYINHIIFPEGRQVEFTDNYLQTESWERILLRCVHFKDFEAFNYLSGFRRRPELKDAADSLREVENLIMSMAVLSADHLGGAHSRQNVSFINAKNLISSTKIGGGVSGDQGNGTADPYEGMGAAAAAEVEALENLEA